MSNVRLLQQFQQIPGYVDPRINHRLMMHLRTFFHNKGFIEAYAMSRLSVLMGCENAATVVPVQFGADKYPLPQSSQLSMEYDLLLDARRQGLFTSTTSYRNEPDPVPGRHAYVFKLFETEFTGTVDKLIALESELIHSLGYRPLQNGYSGPKTKHGFPIIYYRDAAQQFKVLELTNEHEKLLGQMYGPVVFLRRFPAITDPFFNMLRLPNGDAEKLDVLIDGVEVFGSAERSCDPVQMRKDFLSITGGTYAAHLFETFGKERVMRELDDLYLKLNFVPRCGFGLGIGRLILSMQKQHLI